VYKLESYLEEGKKMNTFITKKQTDFIVKLVTERADLLKVKDDQDSVIDFIGNCNLQSSREASEFIEKLLAITPTVTRKAPIMSIAHTGVVADRVIMNRYSKDCGLCGNPVSPNTGIALLSSKQWLTFHKDGECGEPKDGSVLAVQVECWVHEQCRNRGSVFFALPSHTGNNDLDFYSLTASHRATGDLMVLKRILGGQTFESCPVVRMSEAVRVIETLKAMTTEESDDAMKAFADNLGRCCICGRTLTDEISRARGMGSECAKNQQ
jgi:hypothetical protein